MIAYEPSDMPPRSAAAAIAGIFALLLVAGVTAWLVLHFVASGQPALTHRGDAKPPPPRLEVAPRADRLRIEAAAKVRLRGDRARPSIEQAMREVAQEGWRDDASGAAQ